ncbi:hypothetical protein FACS1894214_4160 [Planctomycetales bacterium]|nr:hypothetical protein FACS1894214_4160 [Planctomycetales bacterium]
MLFCEKNNVDAQELLWSGYRAEMPLPTGLIGTETLADGAKKFFLLKTGLLVEATVSTGENSVELKSQYGTMQVPKENIEFAGETREDIYQYKKSLITPNSCTQELNFAEWCLDNNFYNEALVEFQNALLTVPNDNLKNYIQQRLEQVQHNTALTGIKAEDADNTTDADSATDERADSFDRWANGVPKSVFDTFAKKVQPIMVQRCASAACHGSNSPQQFKLNIPRQPGGKTTRNNLRATLQFIDPDNPGASPVLSAMVSRHCGKRALFSVESEQYNNVVDWLQLAAKELPPEGLNDKNGLYNATASQSIAAQNSRNQNTVNQKANETVQAETAKLDTVKLNTLPKQFQESLEAMAKETAVKTEVKPHLKVASNQVIPPQIIKPSSANAEPKTASNISVAAVNKADRETKPNETDPFDPSRFNAKYHSKVIEAKLKRQISDTVIR